MDRIPLAVCGLLVCAVATGWGESAAGEKMDESGAARAAAPGALKFVMHRLGTFRSEACGVADFNNDGKLDIVAGPCL
jgi:hypothetical protein